MTADFRSRVLLTAQRALLGRIVPAVCTVAIDAPWELLSSSGNAPARQVEVHFQVWFDSKMPEDFMDEFDAHVISVVIDECFDYGRLGYASHFVAQAERGQTLKVRGDLLYMRAGVSWSRSSQSA
jgi:hypothetical protein